jgi:molybdate transport system substrate-binding protein
MLSTKMKTLAVGASAALSVVGAPAAHAQFTIGVAANFGNTVYDIINDFSSYYGLDPTAFAVQVDSTGNLKTCILTASTATNYTTNCPVGHYDLFLSADTATPAAVSTLGMVISGVTQAPFFYATGSLDLYGQDTDISSGLPTTFTVPFVIADPSKAPYGFAAMTVLNTSPWSLGLNSTAPYPQTTTGQASFVYTRGNISLTFAAVYNPSGSPTFAYGFVNKSAICTNSGGTEYYTLPGYHHEYLYNDSSHPYGEIVQDGIPIELGQTSTIKTQVINFIDYLGGGGDGAGLADIQYFCYGTTPPN